MSTQAGKKVVAINALPSSSTGTVMRGIADMASRVGYDVKMFVSCGGEEYGISDINSRRGEKAAMALSKLTGMEGCFSIRATLRLCRQIEQIQPNLIHLHVIHNGFINLPILFRFLKRQRIPVVWTMHDCWAFTGHCPHFEYEKCEKWKSGCYHCPRYRSYPKSLFDNSRFMWRWKRKWFTGVPNLTIVAPSKWLKEMAGQSFLAGYPVRVIGNGIDTGVFRPDKTQQCETEYTVLGVASFWSNKKGLDVFIELAGRLPEAYRIVLVGTNEAVDRLLPGRIESIHRTQDQNALARLYASADVFVNPTREETLGLTNLEALACGTPVVTFNAGGSPECIDDRCGYVVACDDVDALTAQIRRICEQHPFTAQDCVSRAAHFDRDARFQEYITLYDALTGR